MPEGVSTVSGEFDALFYFTYWVSLLIFMGVIGAGGFFVFTFRRRHPNERPKPIKDNKLVEMASIVIPTFLVLVVFTWGFKLYVKMNVPPPDAYEIQVRARQWSWEFQYPNGATSFGELHVPADRPVKLNMNSLDVLHSFFVPVFRVKMDVLPDRYTSVWFEATKAGSYYYFCTEYCRTAHSNMIGQVTVHSAADFEQALQDLQKDDLTPVERGEQLYSQQTCNVCHSVDGSAGVGPTFLGLFGNQRPLDDGSSVMADDNYLRESIMDPSAKVAEGFRAGAMPATYSSLPAEDIDALVAYIKSMEN